MVVPDSGEWGLALLCSYRLGVAVRATQVSSLDLKSASRLGTTPQGIHRTGGVVIIVGPEQSGVVCGVT